MKIDEAVSILRVLVDVLAVMDADRRAVALLSDEYYDAGSTTEPLLVQQMHGVLR